MNNSAGPDEDHMRTPFNKIQFNLSLSRLH